LSLAYIWFPMAEIETKLTTEETKYLATRRIRLLDALPGLGVAFCFSISAILVRNGLEVFPYPLLGVTIGMLASVFAFGIWLLWISRRTIFNKPSRATWFFQILAGVFIGLGTWARYIATDLTEVGVVLALGRVNTPLVLLIAPFLFGRHQEPVTLKIWIGAGLIIFGSFLIIMGD
jgi:uncharacterized membrane protein